jgi:hypothetical protein
MKNGRKNCEQAHTHGSDKEFLTLFFMKNPAQLQIHADRPA